MCSSQVDFDNIFDLISKIEITSIDDSVYIVMKNEIEDIYNRLNIYLIEGTFRKDFNYEKIKELLHSQQSKLDDFNIESDQYPECRKMFQGLIKDIQKIWYLNQFFSEKREDNYVFMKRDDTEYDNIWASKEIFDINIDILKLDLLILTNPYQEVLKRLLINQEKLKKLEESTSSNQVINLLKEKIIYHIYRIWQVNDKVKIPVQFDEEKNELHINHEIKATHFDGIKDDFLCLVKENKWRNKSISLYEKLLKESNYERTDILILLSILYKDRGDLDALKTIFYSYEKSFDTTPSRNSDYINYIFVWNCLLSLLVESYANNESSSLEEEIKILFKKSLKNNTYKNYFSYYKYAKHKLIKSEKFLKGNDFKEAKKAINWAIKYIEDAIDIFLVDEHNEYFELRDEDNLILIPNETEGDGEMKFLYCYQKYGIPYSKPIKKKKLEQLKQNILRQENIILHRESIYDLDQYSENNKMNAMTILGLFTGIITYSFGTIQIFSIIENIWDAVLFSGIFLSWMLFLVGSIFLKPILSLKNNKGGLLCIIGLLIFLVSICLKSCYSWDVINHNKANTINEMLQNTINKANIINEQLQNTINKGKL